MNSIGISAAILGLKKILRHWTTRATFCLVEPNIRYTNNCTTLPRPNDWLRRMDMSFFGFTQETNRCLLRPIHCGQRIWLFCMLQGKHEKKGTETRGGWHFLSLSFGRIVVIVDGKSWARASNVRVWTESYLGEESMGCIQATDRRQDGRIWLVFVETYYFRFW